MIYIGIPISAKEACRIFNQPFNNEIYSYKQIEPLKKWMKNFHNINNKYHLCIFPTDKGQHILGYEIEEFYNSGREFKTVGQCVSIISVLRAKFYEDITTMSGNIQNVEIYGIEEYPFTFFGMAEPYVIEYPH